MKILVTGGAGYIGCIVVEQLIARGEQVVVFDNLFDQPEHMPIVETERIVPGSPYGEAKYMLECMLAWLDRIYGLRFAALRYFSACGASAERGEDHHPKLIASLPIAQDDYPGEHLDD